MEDVEKLLKTISEEIEKALTSKTVVGEPIKIEDTTIIPLICMGFGFGAGGGTGKGGGKGGDKGEGAGGGGGGGGGIKPVAVIVVDKEGVRIEQLKGTIASMVEKCAEVMPKMMEKCAEEKEKE
jgi:uncharacterized spore protein YtfJ